MNFPGVFKAMLILGFLVLLVRVIDVSIVRGNYYSALSKENRIRAIPIVAPRGNILDRNGVPLAQNVEGKRVVRFEVGKAARFVEGESARDAEKEIVINFPRRIYPTATESAHLVGFVGETNEEEVEQEGCKDNIFHLGDSIGRMGAEASLDCVLRGKNGEELVEVDTRGRKIREMGRVEPTKGSDIFLSIDARLQERATRALAGRRGSVVALDPKNGEILALVSSPSFNPNEISNSYSKLAADSELPLFNRTIGGAYPPGSTFKIAAAAAAIEEKVIDENFRYIDVGFIKIGNEEFTNWLYTKRGGTEGEINIVRAIIRSTDTFFYKLGEMVGVLKIAEWSRKFGLGEKTGINLSGETAGVIPTPEWKERATGERWFLGNTYNMSIGQGDVAASPIQIAAMTGVIASGKLCKPQIEKIEDGELKVETCKEIGLSEKTLDLVRRGMVGACSEGGTAYPLFNFKVKGQDIQIACKTGTAEFGVKDEYGKTKTHAWLTGYAPASQSQGEPEIVVTVLVEGGGEGSDVAAPIVKEVLDEWFVNR